MVEQYPDTVKAHGSSPCYPTYGRDANGRSTPLQGDCLGSTPTLSTNYLARIYIFTLFAL